MRRRYFRLVSANVLLLGLVSLVNDFSSEMISPILPMFITALGGTGLAIGLIGGLRDSVSSILQVVFGYLSDRIGRRKPFVLSGYLTSAVFKLLLSFSRVWPHVLLFDGLERVGKSLRTAPRDAIISDSMVERRGVSFGLHRAMDTAGAVLGSLAVFVLLWFFDLNLRSVILIAAVIAFFSVVPLFFVKEKARPARNINFKVSMAGLPPGLKKFIVVAAIFALANFSYMFFILRAQGAFSGRLAVGAPILLYALSNVFYIAFSVPFGSLSDRIGRGKVIVLGYALFSLVAFGFVFFDSLVAFIVLFMLYGVVNAILDGTQHALVSDLSSKGLRGTALGTYSTVVGLVSLPAGLLAGFLWNVAPVLTFVFGGVVSALAVVLFILLRKSMV